MYRLSVLALLVPVLAVAAPVPKEKEKGPLYFPVVEGTKREVEEKLGDGDPRLTTETVTKVEEKDGVYTVTLQRDLGGKGGGPPQVFAVSAKGVSRVTSFGKETKNPLVMLNLGVKAGETWKNELENTVGNGAKTVAVNITCTMGKEEEVEVPAGKFKAIRVDTESTRDGKTTKSTIWFAAEVGIVKLETSLGEVKSTQQLKAFTPGKGEKKGDKNADPVGTWQCVEVGGLKRETTLVVQKDGDKLSGTMTFSDKQEAKLNDLVFKDRDLSFSLDRVAGQFKLTMNYKLTVDGDKFSGKASAELNGQAQEMKVEGKREVKKDK